LAEWEAFGRIEPFGERVMHLMLAQLTAVVANANRGKEGRRSRRRTSSRDSIREKTHRGKT